LNIALEGRKIDSSGGMSGFQRGRRVSSHYDWVVRRDVASGLKLLLEILLAIDDGHSGTGKDVRWTDEDRIADFVGESLGFSNAGKFLPCWLIDADT
jgi:hypothetical protein